MTVPKRGKCAFLLGRGHDQPQLAQSDAVEVTTLSVEQLDAIAANNAGAVRMVEATPVPMPVPGPPRVVSDSKERTGVSPIGTRITSSSNGGSKISGARSILPDYSRLATIYLRYDS